MCAVPQPCRACGVHAPACCVPHVPEAQGSLPRGAPVPAWSVPYSLQRTVAPQASVVWSSVARSSTTHPSPTETTQRPPRSSRRTSTHPPRTRPAPHSRASHPPRLHRHCTRSAPAPPAPALHPLCTRSALAPRPLRTRPVPSPLPSSRRRAVGLRRSTARTTSARPAPTRPPASAPSRRAQSSTPTTLSTATPLGQSARAHSSAWGHPATLEPPQPLQRPPSCSRGHPRARATLWGLTGAHHAARMPMRGYAGALVPSHRR